MTYLIDSNILIEAKNRFYGFDFCPGFWQWLTKLGPVASIASIDKVRDELLKGHDDLASWASANPDFFLPTDPKAVREFKAVATAVESGPYLPNAKSEFLSCADPFLVAFAKAHGKTLVTHEVSSNGTKKVKIPNVCAAVGVPCATIYEVLRREKVRLHLK